MLRTFDAKGVKSSSSLASQKFLKHIPPFIANIGAMQVFVFVYTFKRSEATTSKRAKNMALDSFINKFSHYKPNAISMRKDCRTLLPFHPFPLLSPHRQTDSETATPRARYNSTCRRPAGPGRRGSPCCDTRRPAPPSALASCSGGLLRLCCPSCAARWTLLPWVVSNGADEDGDSRAPSKCLSTTGIDAEGQGLK